MTIEEVFNQALEMHRTGKLPEAEALYRQTLAERPDDHEALNLLGVVGLQTGRAAMAAEALARAVSISPATPDYHLNYGAALDQMGKLDEAVAAYRRALGIKADYAQALSNLGNVLRRQGKAQEAISLFRRALALEPDLADALNNLGLTLASIGAANEAVDAHTRAVSLRGNSPEFMYNLATALHRARRLPDAIAIYRKALSMAPAFAEAWNNLGQALGQSGDLENAESACRQAIALKPQLVQARHDLARILFNREKLDESIEAYHAAMALGPTAELHNNLGSALLARGDGEAALAEFRKAVAIRPDYAFGHSNIGTALYASGQLKAAEASYRRAIELSPSFPPAQSNLGTVLKYMGRFAEAESQFRKAIVLKPDHAAAQWNLGLIRLLHGDFAQGWQGYEWRWRVPELKPRQVNYSRPKWTGDDLNGRRILLHTEQGFGDAIHFVRYAELVRRRGGKFSINCQSELVRLFKSVAGVEHVVQWDAPLPGYDTHSALMSLPQIFTADFAAIPHDIPYLSAESEAAARWRARLAGDQPFDEAQGGRRKIGLAWAGRPTHSQDRERSIPLSRFAKLAEIPNLRFISLQKGEQAAQAGQAPFEIADWTSELNDFADTAALIANLDMVICVDTAVAHLAAAMGKPVWILIQWVPDWRWMLERSDSPWYPTARLFRQKAASDWDAPLGELFEALKCS